MSEPTESFDRDGGSGTRGDLVDGRYRLENPVGGGLTATVWRAHDPVLGRDVAVKIWADGSPEAQRSQEDELSAARLADPNLPELLDAGHHDGRPYLVSELRPPDPGQAVPEPKAAVTPATGQRAVARRKRDRVVVATVSAIVVALVIVGAGLIAGPGSRGRAPAETETIAVAPAGITSFDPEGDGAENPDQVRALLDGDRATGWSTDRYSNRSFGNLKTGLGLVVTVSPPRPLRFVEVHTAGAGWSAQIHVAESAAMDLSGWGAPVADVAAAGVSERFDLRGRTVGTVLIWFTDLGDGNRLTVTNIGLTANR